MDYDILIEDAKRTLSMEISAVENAKNRIDGNFIKAAYMIAEAKKVVVSGMGKSGIIGKKISATLSSIGISSVFLHPVESLHGDLGIVQDGDVAILLSKSGSTEEIVRLVPYLKMRNSKVISFVGNLNSFLAKHSDIAIDASVETEACPFNLVPTSSTTLALALGDALAICCMKIRNTTIEDFARLHPLGQLGKNITLKVKDLMHTGEQIPKITMNSAFKDAIIEISNKMLGCVCIVSPENKLIGIITDGDVRRTLQSHEDYQNLKVKDIMTYNPITIKPDAFLGEALAIMENRSSEISMLPIVTENNELIGIIHIHDILRSGK